VWAKTVLFISYDENDGFFDHVAPPTPPPGTPGEYLTVDPLPFAAGGITGPTGLGFRVPPMVLSPFSRGGHVVSEVADHTSQLRVTESRFGVEVPNLWAWRRQTTGTWWPRCT
jgi:phospholipase C